MLKKFMGMAIALSAFAIVLVPFSARAANTVTLTDSNGLTDITSSAMEQEKGDEAEGAEGENFFILCDGADWENCQKISRGTEYEVTFTITGDDAEEGPVMVFVMGGDVDYDNSWSYSYDSTTEEGTLTIPFIKRPFYDEDGTKVPAFGINIEFAVAEGEDGPPSQMAGSYLASTVMENELVPPAPGNPAFGFTLTGASGTSGFVHFYIPPALIELLSYYEGIDLTPSDMAVFMDDDQVFASITETDEGGALIEIDVVFTAGNTTTSGISKTTSVTKSIVAKQKLPISFTPKKSSLKRGKTAKIYGWLKNSKNNQTVRIYRKKKTGTKYNLVKKVTTNKNGYFYHKFVPKKKGNYYYKAKYTKSSGSKLNSSRVLMQFTK